MKGQSGFSLLEAIVAITLLAISGSALFAWLNTMLVSVSRIEAIREERRVVDQSLTVLNSVNPMLASGGSLKIGEYDMRWSALLTEDAKDVVNRYGIQGLYRVGLYDVHVVVKNDDRQVSSYSVKQVGYQKVRQNEL